MKRLVFCLFFVVFVENIQGSQLDNGYHSICLPGQNGRGGNSFQRNGVVATESFSKYSSLGADFLSTGKRLIDLGQAHCIQDFSEQFYADERARSGRNILTAVSQGTATVVNFFSFEIL